MAGRVLFRVLIVTVRAIAPTVGHHVGSVMGRGKLNVDIAIKTILTTLGSMMMPKIDILTTTTQVVEIDARLKRQLLTKLKTYQHLSDQIKALKHASEKVKGEIGGLREETGSGSIEVEGFKVTLVAGTQRSLNKKKFVELGGDLAILEMATETRPKAAYEKISCPGDDLTDED